MKIRPIASLFLIALLFLSCSPGSNPNVNRGSTFDYRPGLPEVRFSAVGFLNESNQPSINLAADVVYASLTYKEVSGQQQAKVAFDVLISSEGNKENAIKNEHYETNLTGDGSDLINSQQSYIFERQIDVPAGSYTIYLTVTDLASNKKITRIANTIIPDPAKENIDLTEIRMLGKDVESDSADWFPVTTYDVPGKIDSLMFIFQATNNSNEAPLPVTAQLVQFKSDTSIARAMNLNNYSRSTIEYKGMEQSERSTIQQTERKLQGEGSVFIEFRFSQQERGNYRFEVMSNKDESELYKARDFGVKSTNYPALKTPRELAQPLAYLMDRDKHEELLSITNEDSLKKAIDEFWLRNIGDKIKAQSVLQLYYQRVEEANKQFSNFKEGWKTDTGMMYVLFGPPWYSEVNFDRLRWGYSYNRTDPELNYVFFQPELKTEYFPFTHYLLEREQAYFDIRYQQRSLWLSGLILERRI